MACAAASGTVADEFVANEILIFLYGPFPAFFWMYFSLGEMFTIDGLTHNN